MWSRGGGGSRVAEDWIIGDAEERRSGGAEEGRSSASKGLRRGGVDERRSIRAEEQKNGGVDEWEWRGKIVEAEERRIGGSKGAKGAKERSSGGVVEEGRSGTGEEQSRGEVE